MKGDASWLVLECWMRGAALREQGQQVLSDQPDSHCSTQQKSDLTLRKCNTIARTNKKEHSHLSFGADNEAYTVVTMQTNARVQARETTMLKQKEIIVLHIHWSKRVRKGSWQEALFFNIQSRS